MAASLLSAVGIPYLIKLGILPPLGFAQTTILQVGFTTVCWLIAAFVAPESDRAKLVEFYKRVHPAGPGWEKVRQEANVTREEVALHGDHMGLATLGWISGCAVIWSSLFCIGNLLYGRLNLALLLLVIFIASGLLLLYVIRNLWTDRSQTSLAGQNPPISEPVAK
jgi:hypothetical protein